MRALLRKIILWALNIQDQPSNAAELDKLAAELRK
jgi:hypothetical protein